MSDKNTKKVKIQINDYDNGQAMRICPKCGKKKPLSEFGLRQMENGEVRNQSWCKSCR